MNSNNNNENKIIESVKKFYNCEKDKIDEIVENNQKNNTTHENNNIKDIKLSC